MIESVICQNCGAEMEPGKKTKTRIVQYTEHTCPNGCPPRLVGRSLLGRVPRGAVIVETEAEVEQSVDALLEELVEPEEEPEMEDAGGS